MRYASLALFFVIIPLIIRLQKYEMFSNWQKKVSSAEKVSRKNEIFFFQINYELVIKQAMNGIVYIYNFFTVFIIT